MTDAQEAPAFVVPVYRFGLEENAQGTVTPVPLGVLLARDPEGVAPVYSIVAGDPDGLFAIDAGTGALSYVGTGEDYESGTASHELTVRASDGALHSDATVIVEILDVKEPLALAQEASVSEPADDDLPATTATTRIVVIGGSATGKIGQVNDRDWFAVALEANKTYRIDLEGSPTGDGTLCDPYLRGVHDKDGELIAGTSDDDSGVLRNSQLLFTATKDGTHYVAAGSSHDVTGTYTLSVEEVVDGM